MAKRFYTERKEIAAMYELKIITMHLNELRTVTVEETRGDIEAAKVTWTHGANLKITGRCAIFQNGQLLPNTIYTSVGFQPKPGDVF
jgi:hypothetical protein